MGGRVVVPKSMVLCLTSHDGHAAEQDSDDLFHINI
jgi:hypothetical protein